MAIYQGSRYQNVVVYNHYTGEKNIPTLSRRNLKKFINEGIIHIFKEGDRIDLISYQYYGDPQLWWVIMDANPQYLTPWDIPPGAVLNIPPYEEAIEDDFE